jgi:hypothetical protein
MGKENMKIRRARSSVIALALAISLGPPAFAQSTAPPPRLAEQLAATDDLHAFALQARNRTAEGGLFYAYYIASYVCARNRPGTRELGDAAVTKLRKARGNVDAWRIEIAGELARRCSGFPEGATSRLFQELQPRLRADDPVWKAERAIRAAFGTRNPEVMRAAVAHALELDDPLLWTADRVWEAVAQFDADPKKIGGVVFDGVRYTERHGMRASEARIALEQGFCTPSRYCSLDDDIRVLCAIGAPSCAKDRTAFAKNNYLANGGTEEGWKRVLVMIDQVRNAVATQNVNFFVR